MKRIMIIAAMFLACAASLGAQDLITKRTGDDIKAKVLEVNPDNIRYRLFDEPDGVIYTIDKSDVLLIRYASGRNELFNTEPPRGESGLLGEGAEKLTAEIEPGMRYSELQYIYDKNKYVPSIHDRYSPAGSTVASAFIPGLGQWICGEVGRGFAWFGGEVGAYLCFYSGLVAGLAGAPDEVSTTLILTGVAGDILMRVLSAVDANKVAKIKNMYYQDLRKAYPMEFSMYPSVDFINAPGMGTQPAVGLTFALRF